MSDLTTALETAVEPVFITHRRADRDSLGSALGLQAILGKGTICTPGGVAAPARDLRDITDAEIKTGSFPDTFDIAVVLDAPSMDRISPAEPDSVLLIDHHEPADLAPISEASIVDTGAGATAELVVRLATSAGWEITPEVALPLLVGLLDDTEFLAGASPSTALTVRTLFDAAGEKVGMLPELLNRSIGRDERIAAATGVMRTSGYRAGDLVVAFSTVGAYEGTVAEEIRGAGVDLAVVCSTQDGELRVTARASDQVAEQVSLGATLLPALVNEFGGEGGGHATAGTATVVGADADAVRNKTLAVLSSELGVQFGKIIE
mgnify:CR=1 FL=1